MIESLKRQNIALFLKTLIREKEQKEFQKRNWADKHEGGNQRDHKSQDDAQNPSLRELIKFTLVGKKGRKKGRLLSRSE